VEEKKKKRLSSRYVIGSIFIVILTDYSEELLLITQICSNPTCREKFFFYSLSYSFIIIKDYPRQDKGLGKRIELWIRYYIDENGLSLNYQSFQL